MFSSASACSHETGRPPAPPRPLSRARGGLKRRTFPNRGFRPKWGGKRHPAAGWKAEVHKMSSFSPFRVPPTTAVQGRCSQNADDLNSFQARAVDRSHSRLDHVREVDEPTDMSVEAAGGVEAPASSMFSVSKFLNIM